MQDNDDLRFADQVHKCRDKEEQNHLDDVCRAFRQYATFAKCQWTNHQSRLNALPDSQQSVLPRALKKDAPEARKRASQYKDAYIRNQFCLDCILRHSGMPHSQEAPSSSFSSDEHVSKVSSVLKSLARDWSIEGRVEREMSYKSLLKCAQKYLPPDVHDGSPPRVCVPGAGVGRLALELSALGYSVQGNEFSLFMLLASDFVLNSGVCTTSHPLEISPWVLESRNVHESSDPFRIVRIPDTTPHSIMEIGPNQSTREFSMAAGDFSSIYSSQKEYDQWDGIVCCFFLDASPNIAEVLQIMYNMLRNGGYLMNFGPLLHHWSGPNWRPEDTSVEEYQKRFHHLDQRCALFDLESLVLVGVLEASDSQLFVLHSLV